MDNPTALEKAWALCLNPHDDDGPCNICKQIAAALKRAYADGMWDQSSDERDPRKTRQLLLTEADQLEGKQ